jgi:hypothetical protein
MNIITLIHRRIPSNQACSNTLNTVRLTGNTKDVDYNEVTNVVPANGRFDQGQHGGISISTFPAEHNHNSADYQREDDVAYPVYGPKVWQGANNTKRKINRFHCYCLEFDRLKVGIFMMYIQTIILNMA